MGFHLSYEYQSNEIENVVRFTKIFTVATELISVYVIPPINLILTAVLMIGVVLNK